MKRLLLPLLLILLTATAGAAQQRDADFSVATYNIRQANHRDSVQGDGWGDRLPHVAGLIRFHGFDIFGTQEGFKHQLDSLQAHLPGYAYIGVGRDDGKAEGEHSAIFYRTDLFDLVDHGDFWLSETPDQPGRLGWDAVCPRICTWGKFRYRPTGQEFLFFNLHMDHVGKRARVESAALVQQKMKEFGSDLPTFLTGDFNVDQSHQSYERLNSGRLRDAYTVSEFVYAPNGTFNSYRSDNFTRSRIDHVFVSPEVEVMKYGVLTDTYRTPAPVAEAGAANDAPKEISLHKYVSRTPSDHFPVQLFVRLRR